MKKISKFPLKSFRMIHGFVFIFTLRQAARIIKYSFRGKFKLPIETSRFMQREICMRQQI